jgi:hypothetical protein
MAYKFQKGSFKPAGGLDLTGTGDLETSIVLSPGAIVDGDIASVTSAGKIAVGAIDISGSTDVGEDLVDADLMVVDNGADGTNRKSTLTRMKKYVYSAMSGDVSVSDTGVLTIGAASVENSMLADDAVDSDELAAGAVDDAHLSDGVATGLAGAGTTATSGVINVIGGNGITANANDIEITPAQTTITSILGSFGKLGTAADEEYIDFGTSNEIKFAVNNSLVASCEVGKFVVNGNLEVKGTTTSVDSTTINISSSFTFEGPADAHETILSCASPGADTTLNLPTLSAGTFYLPALADAATDDSAAVTAAEFALLDGASSIGTTAVADGHGLFMNQGGTMRHTTVQTLAAYLDDEITAMPNLVTVGTIGSGVWNGTALASAYIADDAIDSQHYADGSIDNAHLANDAVGADELADNAVINASIASNAAIDLDKLDGGSCAAALTDLAQGDLMYAGDVDDSNNIKSITFGNLEDAIFGNVSGDATIAAGGALTIAANAIQTGMVHNDVATELAQGAGLGASAGQMSVSAAQTSITSIINANLAKIGTAADEEYIDFGTSNEIKFGIDNTNTFAIEANKVAIMAGGFYQKIQTIGSSASPVAGGAITAAGGNIAIAYTTSAQTVTLPAVANLTGLSFYIKNGGSNSLTLDANASEEIEDATTQVLEAGAAVNLFCDGSKWWIY